MLDTTNMEKYVREAMTDQMAFLSNEPIRPSIANKYKNVEETQSRPEWLRPAGARWLVPGRGAAIRNGTSSQISERSYSRSNRAQSMPRPLPFKPSGKLGRQQELTDNFLRFETPVGLGRARKGKHLHRAEG